MNSKLTKLLKMSCPQCDLFVTRWKRRPKCRRGSGKDKVEEAVWLTIDNYLTLVIYMCININTLYCCYKIPLYIMQKSINDEGWSKYSKGRFSYYECLKTRILPLTKISVLISGILALFIILHTHVIAYYITQSVVCL